MAEFDSRALEKIACQQTEKCVLARREGIEPRALGVPYFPVTANMLLFGPLGLLAYFPAKFKIRVLAPVHFEVSPNQERYSRSRVMDESERIRRLVQEALYDMLRKRRSVWFG